jgi:hypothetical protein
MTPVWSPIDPAPEPRQLWIARMPDWARTLVYVTIFGLGVATGCNVEKARMGITAETIK